LDELTTFGFELELASGADAMVAVLHEAGLLPEARLHRYHCDCDWCRDWTRPLRAQTDSTVQGELISGVFSGATLDDAWDLLATLESAAVQTSAQISERCGIHVHVGHRGAAIRPTEFVRTARRYCAVEEHLIRTLAPGRFASKRQMNRTVLEALRYWRDMAGVTSIDFTAPWNTVLGAANFDRHLDLNFDHGRTGTTEFRLWNASLMSWRVELAVRLSCFLAEDHGAWVPQAWAQGAGAMLQDLAWNSQERLIPSPLTWDELVSVVDATDPACATLMREQARYMRETY
jgi:hypothetical protein